MKEEPYEMADDFPAAQVSHPLPNNMTSKSVGHRLASICLGDDGCYGCCCDIISHYCQFE